jgi:hypothetical protein
LVLDLVLMEPLGTANGMDSTEATNWDPERAQAASKDRMRLGSWQRAACANRARFNSSTSPSVNGMWGGRLRHAHREAHLSLIVQQQSEQAGGVLVCSIPHT